MTPLVLALGGPTPIWSVDLATGDGGFVAGGDTLQWEWGVPATVGPVGSGACWCTSCDGDYLHDAVDWVQLALPDLAGVAEPSLVLRHWYAVRAGDRAIVEVDPGTGFVPLLPAYGYPDPDGFVGASGDFVDAVFDLRGFGEAPVVRLTLTADMVQSDAGWYLAAVELWDGDIVAPSVTVLAPPGDTQDLDGPYVVVADAVDDRGVDGATLWYAAAGGPSVPVPMTGSPYSAEIPGQPPDTLVDWWVEATDGENVGRWPATGTSSFRVFLAAPTGLAAVDSGREVADEVTLGWDPPVTPHAVLGYQVHREGMGMPVAEVDQPTATVELIAGQSQTFTVSAVYDEGLGDPSEPLHLGWEVPVLDAVEPAAGYQGDELYVRLVAESLYFLGGATTVDLGPGIEVLGLDVRDATTATAHLAIDPDASTGLVDVAIDGPVGRFVFPGRFSVVDGADAPRIDRVDPDAIGQGESRRITLGATVDFAGLPVVGVDEDLLVTGEIDWDGDVIHVPLVAGTRARPGLHTLSVDDGSRLYTADLQVDERKSLVPHGCGQGCATAQPGPAWGLLGPGLIAAGLRRRRRSR